MILLGFDIGGTKSAVLVGNDTGEIFYREEIPTSTPDKTLEKLFSLAEKSGYKAERAGVSCGGPLDEKTGVIKSPPNLKGWDNVPITDMIEKRFGIPAVLRNDANACALAEWRLGAGRGSNNMIFLTFGTGLGAGLILDGRLYSGTNGNAGEVGHIRMAKDGPVGFGKAGSLEGFCSGSGLAQMGMAYARKCFEKGVPCGFCKSEDELSAISAKTIAIAADNGDKDAINIYKKCGKYLGKGLSILIDVLNPEAIVIGSIFARSENLLAPAMEKEIKKEALSISRDCVRVVPAQLGEKIGDYAALITAMEEN